MSEHKQSNEHYPLLKQSPRESTHISKNVVTDQTSFGNPSFDCLQGAVNKAPGRKEEISSLQLGIIQMQVLKCDEAAKFCFG